MIQSLNKIDFSNSKLENIKIKPSVYYGKIPKFYEQIDPLTEKEYDFDELCYLKLFLANNGISLDWLYSKLNEEMSRSEKLYNEYYIIKKVSNSLPMLNSMTIFFNILSVKANPLLATNNEKLKFLYKSFVFSPGLNKFPKLYLKYLEDYYKILVSGGTECELNALEILIAIAGLRPLSDQEEK
jgi:hypothetical protein